MWTMFILIMVGVACAVSGLITVRCTATTSLSGWGKVLIGCGIAVVFMSPFLLRHAEFGNAHVVGNVFSYITYFLFVCVFLFFCLMIMRDIVWIAGRLIVPRWVPPFFEAGAVLKANIGLLMIVVALAGYALYEGVRVPQVREVVMYSDKVREPLKIVALPDIHIHRALSANKLREIVKRTNALKPDMIALPGDIVDDRADTIADLVPMLGHLKAPLGTYVVDGNHEIYIGTKEAQKQFRQEKLVYLHNEAQRVRPDVVVAGVPDVQSARIGLPPDMKKTLPQTDSFVVLLAHTPKMFDMPGNTADLQVSGHTHGGQIFPFHFLAKLSNKYLSGLYHSGQRALYVSRGAGQWGPQMRLLAPSEISVITVLPKK